jgi:tetratricopeptide (TPR) repeat protein
MVSHDGGDTGFLTALAMLPEKKIAVVWMTNAEWLSNTDAVTHAALDVALGLEPQPIKRGIAQMLVVTYLNSGIDAAVKQYERLKKLQPDIYDFAEGELNGLGHYLLSNGKTKDAVRIFQLNAATYPSSADTFDALGEAYEKDGNRALAISNYEKAQQLDPKQAHAADALKRLKS